MGHGVLPAPRGCSEEIFWGAELQSAGCCRIMPRDAGVHQSRGNSRLRTGTSKSICLMVCVGWHMTILGKKPCAYIPVLLAGEKGGEVAALLLPGCSSLVQLIPVRRWHGCCHPALTCASPSQPHPHRLGLFFRRSIHLHPAVSALLGKNASAPGMVLIMMV